MIFDVEFRDTHSVSALVAALGGRLLQLQSYLDVALGLRLHRAAAAIVRTAGLGFQVWSKVQA